MRTFDHEKSIRFIDENYTPDRMIFFHQGATPFDKIVKLVEKYFHCTRVSLANREGLPTSDQVNSYRSSLTGDDAASSQPIIIHQDTHQSHVLLGAPTYPIGHEYAAALALLCNILGGPGMNSRLGLELREHYLGIYFGCDHHDVNRCLKLCHKQLERFQDELLSPRQISNAKKQLGGQLGVAMANMENNAIALAKNLLRLGKVETLEQTCNRINSVTPELINKVACEVFDKALLKTVIIQ